MHKTIKVNETQSIELDSALGWASLYQEYFGRDIIPDLLPALEAILNTLANVIEAAEGTEIEDILKALIDENVRSDLFIDLTGLEFSTAQQIIWALAKNQNDDIPEPREFFNQFETFYFDQVMPEVIKLLVKTSVSSKNLARLKAKATKASRSH